MSELKNYIELSFSNPIFIDILERHISNSVLAEIIDTQGKINLKLPIVDKPEPPKTCEDIIGLIYKLFENNTDTAIGAAYAEKKCEILSDTIFELSKLIDGFNAVSVIIDFTVQSEDHPEESVNTHTEFTLNKTKISK